MHLPLLLLLDLTLQNMDSISMNSILTSIIAQQNILWIMVLMPTLIGMTPCRGILKGGDVPATSQSGLHIVAAFLYKIFGAGTSLLDFTILLPVVLGSLTTIVVFALVRTLGGTTAGMFSALLFAFSPAIIQRGNLGWFKSEPLGLFFGLLGVYLLLSALKHKEVKYAILKAIAGGFVLGLANASWGGVQYFSIPISIFFIALPFFRKDTTIPVYVAIAFTVITILTAGGFPRPGISFVIWLSRSRINGRYNISDYSSLCQKIERA